MQKLNFLLLVLILFVLSSILYIQITRSKVTTTGQTVESAETTLISDEKKQLGALFTKLKAIIAEDKNSNPILQQNRQCNEGQQKQTANSAGMTFACIPAGSFQMGDIQGGGESNEQPVHTVTIAQPFYMATTEVTHAQWQAVMSDNPMSSEGDDRPVVKVSWNDVRKFINKLNEQTEKTYRLPTEAEWEYAARADSTTKYSWGNHVGNNRANCHVCGSQWDSKQAAPVASFTPNAFGLYDMHGNVSEWVQDCWCDNYNKTPADKSDRNNNDCPMRVLRGGSWDSNSMGLRSAARFKGGVFSRNNNTGFRLIQEQ